MARVVAHLAQSILRALRALRTLRTLWALPVSLIALPLLPLAIWRSRWRIQSGALWIVSPALHWFLHGLWFRLLAGGSGFDAATIGSVVISGSEAACQACCTHELVHVRQCERWGPLFPFAYIVSGFAAAIRHRRWSAYYWENPFEIEARAAEEPQRDCL